MSSPTEASRRRQRSTRRRRFAYLALFLVSSGVAATHPGRIQDETVQVRRRQTRLLRDAGGRLRAVESLQVAVVASADSLEAAGSTSLARLPGAAAEVRSLGGDLRPGLLRYEAPDVLLAASLVSGLVEVAFTYVLPDSQGLTLVSELPVDSLIVEIQQGSVAARVGERLVEVGEGGPPERPYRIYAAKSIEPGEAIEIEIVRSRTSWRERFAVLVVTGAAVLAALLRARRGSASGDRQAATPVAPRARGVGGAGQAQ